MPRRARYLRGLSRRGRPSPTCGSAGSFARREPRPWASCWLSGSSSRCGPSDALRTAGWSFLYVQNWAPEKLDFGVAGDPVRDHHHRADRIDGQLPLSLGTALLLSEGGGRQAERLPRLPRRPDGRRAQHRLRPVVRLLPAGAPSSRCRTGSRSGFGWVADLRRHRRGRACRSPRPVPTWPPPRSSQGSSSGFMVVPTQTSIMREAFTRAPMGEREGAYAPRRHQVGHESRSRSSGSRQGRHHWRHDASASVARSARPSRST